MIFGSQQIFGSKNNLVKKMLGTKIFDSKSFGLGKYLSSKNFGPEIIFGSKDFGHPLLYHGYTHYALSRHPIYSCRHPSYTFHKPSKHPQNIHQIPASQPCLTSIWLGRPARFIRKYYYFVAQRARTQAELKIKVGPQCGNAPVLPLNPYFSQLKTRIMDLFETFT